jgi:hypothetical protein
MSDKPAAKTAKNSETPARGKPFAPGFDERRWLKGRPRVPKDTAALMTNLLWEIASEEITNPTTGEKVDRLRALIRSLTTSKHSADKIHFLDRLAGKVTERVDVTSGGEKVKGYIGFTPDQWDKKDDN